MFIQDENGNMINTRYITEIYISEPYLAQTTYNIVAHIHMNGNRILSRYETKKGAQNAIKKYMHMD